jgi:stage II sporulation protein D
MRYRDELVKYRQYRGKIRVLVTPLGLRTINILPLESYLRGVVPAEVPATWPTEAVKAQAVAARTYAWSRLKDTRDWDVVPTAANQVYGGYQHEHPASDAAVSATANLVLTYQGKVISALYHAAAGGHTENSEYAFVNDRGDPGNTIAYLRGKPDVDPNGVPYDITAGTYSWTSGQFTMEQLSWMLANNQVTDVGEIYNITYWRGVSGRVYRVLLEGSAGS